LKRIAFAEVVTQEQLGKGSAASVVAGVFQGARVALKIFTVQKKPSAADFVAGEPVLRSPLAELRMEACLMQYACCLSFRSACDRLTSALRSCSDLRHENIVAMIGISLAPVCIVMELLPCNLMEYLRESVPLNWRLRASIACDVIFFLLDGYSPLTDCARHELPPQCLPDHRAL
jgi:hypothetical protein